MNSQYVLFPFLGGIVVRIVRGNFPKIRPELSASGRLIRATVAGRSAQASQMYWRIFAQVLRGVFSLVYGWVANTLKSQ